MMGCSVPKVDQTVSDFFCSDDQDLTIGVAVSGGSDSVALLLALTRVFPAERIKAVTIDHGLRVDAPYEAEWVGRLCSIKGVGHQVLKSTNLLPGSNLQARARDARYALLAKWGQCCDILCLGHSQTDLVETFLMRLARGSGVDGLSAMAERWTRKNLKWARPLLTLSRQELRQYLKMNNQDWCDDPSNNDLNYTRVRIRESQKHLEYLGFNPTRLANTANRMSNVREALNFALKNIRPKLMQIDLGDILLDRTKLAEIPVEFSERIVAESLCWVGQQIYRPRIVALRRAIATKAACSLHGCVVIPQPDNFLRITREHKLVKDQVTLCPTVWDGRYYAPEYGKDYKIKSLGKTGLLLCPDWRTTCRPRASLIASPSIWQGDDLISAPLANFGAKDVVQVVPTPWDL